MQYVRPDVGNQDDDGGEELQKRPVDALDVFDEFVEQDNRGIEHGGAQTEEDAGQAACVAGIADARDEHETKRGHRKAYDLEKRQLFPEEEGADERNDDGREIIAQRSHGNGSVLVRFKE